MLLHGLRLELHSSLRSTFCGLKSNQNEHKCSSVIGQTGAIDLEWWTSMPSIIVETGKKEVVLIRIDLYALITSDRWNDRKTVDELSLASKRSVNSIGSIAVMMNDADDILPNLFFEKGTIMTWKFSLVNCFDVNCHLVAVCMLRVFFNDFCLS